MTPSQKGRYGCEAARNPKWRLTAPPVPALKRPVGVPQPWPLRPHPAGHVHRSHFLPPPPPPPPQLPLFHTRHAGESAERPHLVTVVRPCGHSTLRKVTVLLNRRGVASFEQLLLDISEALGFPRWHRARVTRLYTTHAREVKGVCDFFGGEVAFLALGKARPELSSVHEALEELFPEHSHYRADALRAWERRLRPPPDKAAKADSGYSEGTEGSGTNQETHQDTKNHKNTHKSQHTDNHKPEKYNFDSQKSEKKNLSRKPALPPNHLQRLHIRGGVRQRQASVIGPFQHEDAFREEDVLSPALCENCLSRRGKHQGAELINTLSGRVPLPPVSRKHKGSPPIEQEVINDTSSPQPVAGGEEKSLVHSQLLNSASDVVGEHAGLPRRSTLDPPSEDRDVTLSDIERCYDIGRVVGDGNFAVVRECRRRDGGQALAMKIVERSKLIGREHMMQNELSLLGSLCHPRIVRLFAHHHTHSHSYLVMELVSGGDLFEAISESGKFSEAAAGLMVSDVSEALNYIHCKSIVHRDLKPENLLIEQVAAGICRLKLGDFGLAMVVTEPVFTICGTPTYVAPEILCETGYGVEVDVWALGVILYILLCGFPPFRSRDRDQEELFQLIKRGQLHFPSPYWDCISEEARGLIRALLQPDPTMRLAAEQTLRHPWVKAMASICKQRALTDRSVKNIGDTGAEPERLQIPAQTHSAESQGNKTSGHIESKAGISHKDLRLYDEKQTNKNRGGEIDRLQKQNIREINSVQITSPQIEDCTPGQEKDFDSTEKFRPQNPGLQLSNTDCVDLNQSHEAQTDPSNPKLRSPQESPADSHPPNNTAGPPARSNPSLSPPTASPSPRQHGHDLTSPLHNPTAAPLQNHSGENHNSFNARVTVASPPAQS